MPVLPASGYATPQAPSVDPLPLAPGGTYDIRAGAESFGGAQAEALTRLGASFEKASGSFENIHRFYEETAADDQSLKTQIAVNKLMYGDPDIPEDRGFVGLEGEHAMREMPVRRKAIEKIIADSRAGLKSQYAASRYDNEIQRFRNTTLSEMGRKYDAELSRHREKTDKGRLDLSMGDMSRTANTGEMAAFKEKLVADEALVREQGERNGTPKEAIDAEVMKRRGAAAKEMAEALLAKDALQGRAFIRLNGDILGNEHPNLSVRADQMVTKQMAQDLIDGKDVSRYSEKLPEPGGPVLVRGGAVEKRITEAAREQGLDTKTALTIASLESRLGTVPNRPGSQYQGVYQLGDAAADQVGGREVEHGVKFVAQTKASLTRKLGREPTGPELYLAHQQGVAGAVALINNPDKPAGTLVPRSHISANGGNPDAPASAFVNHWRTKYDSHASRLGGSSTAPAQPATSAGTDQPPPTTAPATSPPSTSAPPAPGAPAAPTTGNTRADALLATLPPPDEGQEPDKAVPGLEQALADMAKKIPADAPPGVWNTVARDLRVKFNARHTDTQRAIQAKAQADKEADNSLQKEYRLRIGTDNPPTSQEALSDKRWRNENSAQEMYRFLKAETLPIKSKDVTDNNTADLHRRIMSDTDPDKITDIKTAREAYYRRDITLPDLEKLEKVQLDKLDAKKSYVVKKTDTILKGAVRQLIRPFYEPGDNLREKQQDEQALAKGQLTGGSREVAWQNKVDQAVEERVAAGKSTADLFDPKPGNSAYIGSPEFLAEFIPPKEITLAPATPGVVNLTTIEGVRQAYNNLATPQDRKQAREAVAAAFKAGKFGNKDDPAVIEKVTRLLEDNGLVRRTAPGPAVVVPFR